MQGPLPFCKVIANAPVVIVRLVLLLRNVKDTWSNVVMNDIEDIRSYELDIYETMPSPFDDVEAWLNAVCT